jgi:hypothetical protein
MVARPVRPIAVDVQVASHVWELDEVREEPFF